MSVSFTAAHHSTVHRGLYLLHLRPLAGGEDVLWGGTVGNVSLPVNRSMVGEIRLPPPQELGNALKCCCRRGEITPTVLTGVAV